MFEFCVTFCWSAADEFLPTEQVENRFPNSCGMGGRATITAVQPGRKTRRQTPHTVWVFVPFQANQRRFSASRPFLDVAESVLVNDAHRTEKLKERILKGLAVSRSF
jgi:hypothetical protein